MVLMYVKIMRTIVLNETYFIQNTNTNTNTNINTKYSFMKNIILTLCILIKYSNQTSMKTKISIPIKHVPECDLCVDPTMTETDTETCKRENFIKQCVPLLNIKNAGINLLNWDQTGYLWYDYTNTDTNAYIINKNFTIGPSPSTNNETISYEQKTMSYLNSYIGQKFNIPSIRHHNPINFDVYYLFVEQKPIFELLFKYIDHTKANIKNIQSIFSIDSNGHFLAMSFKFNIFSVSLLCNKFFEIIPLFLNDYNYTEQELIKHLSTVFEGFDLLSLYLLIDYYKSSLVQINNKYNSSIGDNGNNKEFVDYYNYFFKNVPVTNTNTDATKNFYKNSNPFEPIANIENGGTMKMTIEKIYKEFVKTIVFLRKMFVELNKLIVNYDKVFLMCVLSFRIREKLIASTWVFDINYHIDRIVDLSYETDDDQMTRMKIRNVYLHIGPELKEYTGVEYNGVEFTNCMENTILQFMKLLFYNNDERKYDMSIIRSLVRDEMCDDMIDIIENVEYENSTNFDTKWVDFLMKLPVKYRQVASTNANANTNTVIENYDLVMPNYGVEMRSSIKNFRIVLKMVFMDKYHNDNTTIFVNNILHSINPSYAFTMRSTQDNYGMFGTTCDMYIYGNYRMSISKGHSKFEHNVSTKTNLLMDIDVSYQDFDEYFDNHNNWHLIYIDIIGYLFYKYSSMPDKKMEQFIEGCMKQYPNIKLIEKYHIFAEYLNSRRISFVCMNHVIRHLVMFKDNGMGDLIQWEQLSAINNLDFWIRVIKTDHFIEDWNAMVIKNAEISNGDLTVWHFLAQKHWIDDNFWIYAIDKQAYKYWHKFSARDKSVFDTMFQNEYSWKTFWNKYFSANPNDMSICEKWHLNESRTWSMASVVIKIPEFWINVFKNGFQTKWTDGSQPYSGLMRRINDYAFWNWIIDNGLCLNWFVHENDAWFDAVEHLHDKNFWIKTIDKQLYLSWNIKKNTFEHDGKTVWHELALHNKNMIFWYKVFDVVSDNELDDWYILDDKYETVWDNFLKQNIDTNVLMKILDKNVCNGWNINQLWIKAIKNISNVDFWKKVIERQLYESWLGVVTTTYGRDTMWHLIVQTIKDIGFWDRVFDIVPKNVLDNVLNVHNDFRETPWKLFLSNQYVDENLMLKILDKGLCNDWCTNGLFEYMLERPKLRNFTLFWYRVLEKKLYENCDWGMLVDKIDGKCWDKFIENDLYIGLTDAHLKALDEYYGVCDEQDIGPYQKFCAYVKQRFPSIGLDSGTMSGTELNGGNSIKINHYKKYIKYKNKYMELKKNISNTNTWN